MHRVVAAILVTSLLTRLAVVPAIISTSNSVAYKSSIFYGEIKLASSYSTYALPPESNRTTRNIVDYSTTPNFLGALYLLITSYNLSSVQWRSSFGQASALAGKEPIVLYKRPIDFFVYHLREIII